jgi:25S rRNA (uracil2634-N3)-methyltransferase
MNVLTVGDGDFSFSLAVAKLVASADNDSGGMVVATSYEDKPTLQRVYPAFEDTLNSLQNCDTKTIVGYNVDATQLNQTLPSDVLQSNVKYHRICWNFPCTAIGRGQDGQNDAMEENKELVRKFMVNALPYLDKDCGEIHIAHKTKPPYNQWQMEKIENGNENFEYKGRLVFDKQLLPPYTPRKALDKKSFPCHDACIYIFGFRRASGEESTIPCGKDVDNDELSIQQQAQLCPSSVIPVTTQLINNVRSIHMKLAVYRQEELKQRSKKRSGNGHQGRKKQRRRK